MNRELGKRYYTAKDYYGDMKKAGLEPYNPESVKHRESKPYEPSEWLRAMQREIKNHGGKPIEPGSRFAEELRKRGYTQEKADLARKIANEHR